MIETPSTTSLRRGRPFAADEFAGLQAQFYRAAQYAWSFVSSPRRGLRSADMCK